MALNQAEVADVRREFDGALDALAQQEAGEFQGDPNQPIEAFLSALCDVTHNPIAFPEHLEMLNRGITYLMAEGPQPYAGTIDQAIDEALAAAIRCADLPDQALLAMARYRLGRPRLAA